MHKTNIRFAHTYNAGASVFIVGSPERQETTDYGEYYPWIFHVD